MQINYSLEGESLRFYLKGELDEHYAKGVKEYVEKIAEQNFGYSRIIFNMSEMTFMDSTGIGVLLGRYKKFKKLGVKCFIENPTVSVEKVLELSGIYEVMSKI